MFEIEVSIRHFVIGKPQKSESDFNKVPHTVQNLVKWSNNRSLTKLENLKYLSRIVRKYLIIASYITYLA